MAKTCVALCITFANLADGVRTVQQLNQSDTREEKLTSNKFIPPSSIVGVSPILSAPMSHSPNRNHPIHPISTIHPIPPLRGSSQDGDEPIDIDFFNLQQLRQKGTNTFVNAAEDNTLGDVAESKAALDSPAAKADRGEAESLRKLQAQVAELQVALDASEVEVQTAEEESQELRYNILRLKDALRNSTSKLELSEANFDRLKAEVLESKAREEASANKIAFAETELWKLEKQVEELKVVVKGGQAESTYASENALGNNFQEDQYSLMKRLRHNTSGRADEDTSPKEFIKASVEELKRRIETTPKEALRTVVDVVEEPLKSVVDELKRKAENKESELRQLLAKTFEPALFPQDERRKEARLQAASKLLAELEEFQKPLKKLEEDLRHYKEQLGENTQYETLEKPEQPKQPEKPEKP